MKVLQITKDNFTEEVLKSTVPVLIDFYASWCEPCKKMAPIIEEIADEAVDAKICKIDVDEQSEISDKYEIEIIPTLVVFEGGKAQKRFEGTRKKEDILKMIY